MYEEKDKIEMPDLLEMDEIKPDVDMLISELHHVPKIDNNLYVEYDVKRGLRDSNGKGVLTGLTEVSDVVAFDIVDGDKVPCDGRLYYQGINVMDIVNNLGNRIHGFEEVSFLLLFGHLPNRKEL